MTVAFADRCRQTSLTKGTGPFVLQAPEPSWFTLASGYAVDVDMPIVLVGRTAAGAATGEVVVGRGHLNGAGELVVDTIERSSAGGPVAFNADVVEAFAPATTSALAEVLLAAFSSHLAASDPHADRAYFNGIARPGVTVLGSNTIVASFSATRLQTRAATGAVTVDGADYASALDLVVRITNTTATAIPITVVAAWRWLTDAPTTLGAGQTLVIEASANGATEDTVFARSFAENAAIGLMPVQTMMALIDANVVKGLNGALVPSIENLGGVVCSFSSVRLATQPTLTSGPNSEIVFDGSNDFLQSTVPPFLFEISAGDATIYMVLRSLTAHLRTFVGSQSSGVAGWVLFREVNGAIRFRLSTSGFFAVDVSSAAGVLTLNDSHLITVILTTTTIVIRVDGVVVISAAAATIPNISAARGLTLGGDGSTGSNCHMALRVFALFVGAHSAGEVGANEAALAARYGTFPVAP